MGNLRIKLKYKSFEIELEGDKNTVQEEFKDIKENGLGNILGGVDMTDQAYIIENPSPTLQIPSKAIAGNPSGINHDEYPSIKDIVMKQLPSSESEWIMVYSFYASGFGSNPFTNKDLLDFYDSTKRKTDSRTRNLSNNLKTIFKKGYLSALNDDDIILTDDGKHQAVEIITRTHSTTSSSTKPSKKAGKSTSNKESKKKSSPATQSFKLDRNLNLRPDNKQSLRDFSEQYNLKSANEKILIISYYLKEVLEMDGININHIYTGFEELNFRVPKSLYQLVSDTKNKSGWLDFDNMEDIGLSIQGKNYIKHDIEKSNS